MKVHLSPETEEKLTALSIESGRGTDELVEDAMAGFLDEVVQVRTMLENRYDDLKSGNVRPLAGDEVEAYFRQKGAARRA